MDENRQLYKKKFQPIVRKLKSKMKKEDINDLPEYLDSGSTGNIFLIKVDGKSYVAKLLKDDINWIFDPKALEGSAGIPNSVQTICYSLSDRAVIMELLPGVNVSKRIVTEKLKYPGRHILQLIETMIALSERGITIDATPANFLYCEKMGFQFLDFNFSEDANTYLVKSIIYLGQNVLVNGIFQPTKALTPDERVVEQYKVYFRNIIHFLTILEKRYPQILEDWRIKSRQYTFDCGFKRSQWITLPPPDHVDLAPYLIKLKSFKV